MVQAITTGSEDHEGHHNSAGDCWVHYLTSDAYQHTPSESSALDYALVRDLQ